MCHGPRLLPSQHQAHGRACGQGPGQTEHPSGGEERHLQAAAGLAGVAPAEAASAQHPRVGSGETAPQRMGVVGEGLSLVFMKPPVSTH